MEGLNDCIDTWCDKHCIDKSAVTEWKYKVISKADEKIKILSNNTSGKDVYEYVLQQKEPLNTLINIHNEFVVTPIDKANGNVAFTCLRFYALVLIKLIKEL